MHTPLCDQLGIEFPIFAFTHCRDVVVAVSKAGGFGVLGAVGFTPEELEIELKWIDEHIGDRPYGVDIVIPNKYEGMDSNMSGEELTKMLQSMVPAETLDFGRKLLRDHGVPLNEDSDNSLQLLGWTEATATPQVEIALQHPKVTLIANALGTPPADMIEKIVGGQVAKYFAEKTLLEQPFVKNPDMTVGDLVKDHIARLGENIVVRQFKRIELGVTE